MGRIRDAFSLKQTIFIPFIISGYPTLDSTVEIIKKLDEIGVGIIEMGVPFFRSWC